MLVDQCPYLADMPILVREGRPTHKTHGRWTDVEGFTYSLLSGRHDGYCKQVDEYVARIGPARPGSAR
jgi:hypothetical protein